MTTILTDHNSILNNVRHPDATAQPNSYSNIDDRMFLILVNSLVCQPDLVRMTLLKSFEYEVQQRLMDDEASGQRTHLIEVVRGDHIGFADDFITIFGKMFYQHGLMLPTNNPLAA
jgi:hypothetical protein